MTRTNMTSKYTRFSPAAALACLMLVSVVAAWGRDEPQGIATSSPVTPGAPTVTTEWHYTLTARVRPLLFWISREDVGSARISWAEGDGGSRAAELLIGSDPARAPMRINRWGYIGERVTGPISEILGVMTTSDEQSIDQAKAGLRRGSSHWFKAIRGGLKDGVAYSTVVHVQAAEDFTYRDAGELLRRLPPAGLALRHKEVPADIEPGFLFAMKSLIHEIVDNYNREGRLSRQRARRVFVYNSFLYQLVEESSHFQPEAPIGRRKFKTTIESRFQTRNAATGESSDFTITYGTQAPIAETPVRVVYRPRWWLEVELLLQDSSEVLAAAGGATCRPFSR